LRLASKANALIEQLKAGTSLRDLAAAEHVTVQTASGLKRKQAPEPLSPGALNEIFRTPKDGTGTALSAEPAQRIVFRVTDVTAPALDPASEGGKRLNDVLLRSLADDVGSEYLVQLESEIGTSVNPSALSQVVGGGTN
jgi:peptidyl-prolyl cis-trans isomerase D